MLCSRFLRAESSYAAQGSVYRASEHAFNWLLAHHERALKWVLSHQIFVLFLSLITFASTLWLYVVVPKGFFPQQDTGLMIGITEALQDISFAAMTRLQHRAAHVVLADLAVNTLGSFIGAAAGSSTVNNGRMFISLKPLSKRKVRVDEVISRLRRNLAGVEGITLFLQPVQDMGGDGSGSAGIGDKLFT